MNCISVTHVSFRPYGPSQGVQVVILYLRFDKSALLTRNGFIGFIGVSLSQTKVPMTGIRDPEEHQRRRRPWNRGLAPAALREYDHLIAARVQQLVRRLEEQDGEVILGKWFYYFS